MGSSVSNVGYSPSADCDTYQRIIAGVCTKNKSADLLPAYPSFSGFGSPPFSAYLTAYRQSMLTAGSAGEPSCSIRHPS